MRQYGFMLRGLHEVEKSLNALNIPFYLLTGAPDEELSKVADTYHAGALVTDFDPLCRGKKIIEWSRTPEDAFKIALYLNDKYELDGRDPNGFTGIAWCFGMHDRPWKERAIVGKLRYVNANGLRRKFDADAYVQKVAAYQA
jgi:deoxyribodipyrimidine photolyase